MLTDTHSIAASEGQRKSCFSQETGIMGRAFDTKSAFTPKIYWLFNTHLTEVGLYRCQDTADQHRTKKGCPLEGHRQRQPAGEDKL